MPVLPLSKNIGPGNVPNPSTENWVDGLAYAHDQAYGSAKSQADISAADSEFINQVLRVPDSNPLVAGHQLLSVLGIGVKKGFESVFGHVYPPGLPLSEMEADSSMEAPPLSKRAKMSAAQKVMAGQHGAAAGGGPDKIMDLPCDNITNLGKFTRCYTYDLELVTFNPGVFKPNEEEGIRPWWAAPCYTFAIEQLGWYLNQGDINYLRAIEGDLCIKHCEGTISIGTITSPFATSTASSTQTSANTHTNVTMYAGKGLEYHYQVYNGNANLSYSTTTGGFELTEIGPGLYPLKKLHQWTFPATPGGTGTLEMPATQVIRSYNTLTCFPYSVSGANQSGINNVPNWKTKMAKAVETTAGSVLNKWSYQPDCYLRLQNTCGQALLSSVSVACPFAGVTPLQAGNSTVNSFSCLGEGSNNGVFDELTPIGFNRTRHLSHSGTMDPFQMLPREYVGFLPPTTIAGATIQPIKIHIQVQTKIEIEHSINTDYFTNADTNIPAQAQQFRFPNAAFGSMKRFAEGPAETKYPFHGYEGMTIL